MGGAALPVEESATTSGGGDLLAALDHADLQAVLDTFPAPTFVAEVLPEHDVRTAVVNRRMRQLAGAEPDAVGLSEPDPLTAVLGPGFATFCRCSIDSDRTLERDFRWFSGVDEHSWRVTLAPLRDRGGVVVRLIGAVQDTTPLWRETERLRQSEARLHDALDHIEDGVALWDAAGRLTFRNAAYDSSRGPTDHYLRANMPSDRIRTDLPSRPSFREETLSDGRVMLWWQRSTADGGTILFSRDVTAQRQVERRARRGHAVSRSMLDSLEAAVMTASRTGIVLGINRSAAAWLGIEPDAALGRRLAAVVCGAATVLPDTDMPPVSGPPADPDGPDGLEADLHRVVATGTLRQRQLIRQDRILDASLFPIHGENQAVAAVALVGRDVTDERAADAALRECRRAMAHCQRVATMGELAAAIAHELSQPVSALITNGHTALAHLIGDDAGPEVIAALGEVCRDAERAGAILGSIAAFVRREPQERSLACINGLVDTVAELVRKDLERRDIALILDLDEGLPAVAVNPIEIEQVILNLLRNSAAALIDRPAGQRRIMVATQAAEGPDGGAGVVVSVQDSGPGFGIPADRLFAAFQTSKPDGLGIGLVICRNIVESHGGTITAEVPETGGALVSFVLPAGEAARGRG